MKLDDKVKITLTERGARLINDQNTKRKLFYPDLKLRTDYTARDEYRTSLRNVIGIFGNYSLASKETEDVFTDLQPIKE